MSEQKWNWTKLSAIAIVAGTLPMLCSMIGQATDIGRTPERERRTAEELYELRTNCVAHWQLEDTANAEIKSKLDLLQSMIALKR